MPSAFTNDKGYLTNADLSAYATLDKLENDSTYLKGLIDANTGNIAGLTADLNANYYNKTHVNDTLDKYYTKSQINDTLNAYAKTSDIPVEKKYKATATENQTAFTLTEAPDTTHYFVKLFINGIMVGDHEDGVITVDGTTVTYVPGQNGGNQLRAGDRVVIYYLK